MSKTPNLKKNETLNAGQDLVLDDRHSVECCGLYKVLVRTL